MPKLFWFLEMIWDLPKNQIHVNWYLQQILSILLGPPFQASETETKQKEMLENSLHIIKSYLIVIKPCRVASSKTSHLEPHPGFYRLLMKGIFDAYTYTV